MQSSQRAAFLFSCFSPTSPLLWQQVWICCLLSVLTQHSSCLVCSRILWLHFWVYLWTHDQWSLSQGTLWGLGWEHLFQRYLYSLQSDSCMKVYFKLTVVVQTNFWTTKVRQNQPQISHKSGLLLWSLGSIFSPCKQDQRIDAFLNCDAREDSWESLGQ